MSLKISPNTYNNQNFGSAIKLFDGKKFISPSGKIKPKTIERIFNRTDDAQVASIKKAIEQGIKSIGGDNKGYLFEMRLVDGNKILIEGALNSKSEKLVDGQLVLKKYKSLSSRLISQLNHLKKQLSNYEKQVMDIVQKRGKYDKPITDLRKQADSVGRQLQDLKKSKTAVYNKMIAQNKQLSGLDLNF